MDNIDITIVIWVVISLLWCFINPYSIEKRRKVKCPKCGITTRGYQSQDKTGEIYHPFSYSKIDTYEYVYRCPECKSKLPKYNWEY